MTVLLLRSYATFAQGAIVDLDNATEAALVNQGRATYTVNPGPVFDPLTASEQQALRDSNVGSFTAAQVAATQALVSGAGEMADWATLTAARDAGTLTTGRVYTVMAPIFTNGVHGTQWVWTGTLLRPAGAQAIAVTNTLVNGVSGGTTAEQILFQRQLPAGLLAGARSIRVRSLWLSSGTDGGSALFLMRLGTLGTVADGEVSRLGNLGASSRQFQFPVALLVASSTSVERVGVTSSTQSPDLGAPDGAGRPGATGVPNMLTTSLWVSLSVTQSASPTQTYSLHSASLYLE